MKTFNLKDMIGGWFIGNFSPTLLKTNEVEVAVKKYKTGDFDLEHYHKIGTEYTVILKGKVKMLDKIYNEDEIIVIFPMEKTDFRALEDTITLVVKIPGANNDKYLTQIKND